MTRSLQVCCVVTAVIITVQSFSVLGMEGAMWSELIRTADQMHSMVFPRLLAIAERAWHKGTWEDLEEEEREDAIAKDWVKFANMVGYKELKRLDKLGVAYRVPPPKARFVVSTR